LRNVTVRKSVGKAGLQLRQGAQDIIYYGYRTGIGGFGQHQADAVMAIDAVDGGLLGFGVRHGRHIGHRERRRGQKPGC